MRHADAGSEATSDDGRRQAQACAYSRPPRETISKPVPPHLSQGDPVTRTILVQVAAQAGGLAAPPQLLLRPALDLPDALAAEAHRLPDLLQRLRLVPVEAEPHPDDLALLVVEAAHHVLDAPLEGRADHLHLGRGHRVLLERVAELEVAVVAHRGRERHVVPRGEEEPLVLVLRELRPRRELLRRRGPLEL